MGGDFYHTCRPRGAAFFLSEPVISFQSLLDVPLETHFSSPFSPAFNTDPLSSARKRSPNGLISGPFFIPLSSS